MFSFNILNTKKKLNEPWNKYYTNEQLDIKIPNISMYTEIKRTSNKYPRNIAIEYMGKEISYKELLKKIDSIAKGFYSLGIRAGDIVTIMLPNIPEALISLYALNKLGAVANMTHPLSAEDEVKETLISTKSKLLIIYDAMYEKIENNIDETCVEKVIFVSPADSLGIIKRVIFNFTSKNDFKHHEDNDKYIDWNFFAVDSKYEEEIPKMSFGKNTPAVILHSGGTSGRPKNVVIQNRAFILGAKQESIALINLIPGDCCLAIMPNFHGFGLSVLMHTPLSLGCYTILIPKFDAKKFDTLFKKTKPTCVLGVPTLFEALINCDNEKKLDLSFLKYVVSGGDILNTNLENKINDYLSNHNSSAHITQGYGLSEALAAVTLAHDDVNKSGSVGIPLPGNHVKIIDQVTRKEKPYGEVGEIVVNTRGLMIGYLNEESETNDALQIHDDGYVWLHTGDLGCMDEDGFIFYKGRIKRMIITSGYNVYPSHIEEILEKHPAVLQCTVVGVPHPYKQEVPKAFVVLKDGFHGLFIKNELKNYCKKTMAKYMVPSEIVIRKKLPKTKLGKVDFAKLKEDTSQDEI